MVAWVFAGLMIGAVMTSDPVPPARDGNVAIQQELDAARCKGSIAAYDLFIARHPGHPLVRVAKGERQRLVEKTAKGGASNQRSGCD